MPNLAHVHEEALHLEPINEARGIGMDIEQLRRNLGNQWWRLNNLYRIVDKSGQMVQFKPNRAQELFYRRMWYGNLILKARQLGFSTFIEILLLDMCLFIDNFNAVVIAHGKEEASSLFQQKILFAYNQLPDALRQERRATSLSKTELQLSNGSRIRVATSARSGTFRAMHISEFGKICARYPQRADEIVSGSLPALAPGGLLFIESTAEGQGGHFHQFCRKAQDLALMARKLGKTDHRFFFYPWHFQEEYRLDVEEALATHIPKRLVDYFRDLEENYGIELDQQQRAWYAKTEEVLGPLMFREHPSVAEEAFAAQLEGAYYSEQIYDLRRDGRLTSVGIQDGVPVDTWWDIGIHDYCVVIMTQTVGTRIHVVDWYMNHGKGAPHYAEYLNTWAAQNRVTFGNHFWPHDGNQREWGSGKSRPEMVSQYGMKPKIVPRENNVQNGIDRVRALFRNIWVDEENCSELLDHWGAYRKDWDANLGAFKSKPLHDEHSHPADALRTGLRLHPMARAFNAHLGIIDDHGVPSPTHGTSNARTFDVGYGRGRVATPSTYGQPVRPRTR